MGPSALSSRNEGLVRRAGGGGMASASFLAYLFPTFVTSKIVLTAASSGWRELVQVKCMHAVVMVVRTWGGLQILFEYSSCVED